MTKQEVISLIYRLKNDAYNKRQELNQADFHYWTDDKIKYETQYKCYDKCLELLMKLD